MAIDEFPDASLERLSVVIGEQLTGGRITQILDASRLPQPEPTTGTKWRRIYASLAAEQRRSRSGACVVRLVQEVGAPQRWSSKAEFDAMRDQLNHALAFSGLTLHSDGQVGTRAVATTHDEAAAASARRLQDELTRRGGHSDVFRYCSAELLAEDCFNAVLEATKGLAERLRGLTGLDVDGYKLVDAALLGKDPMLALNSGRTETERNEQVGVASLMKGCFSAFRNPTAHEPKVSWHVSEADALDVLSTLSLIHRRLDGAVVLRTA